MGKRIVLLLFLLLMPLSAFGADCYCDFDSGNDSTGAGTTGNPYKTLQKCIDVSNGDDFIYVSNDSAQVLSSALSFTSGFGGTKSAGIFDRLTITVWDRGGATRAYPDGTTYPEFEIDGNDAVASIFDTTGIISYVTLDSVYLHDTTSTTINHSSPDYWIYTRIYMDNTAGPYAFWTDDRARGYMIYVDATGSTNGVNFGYYGDLDRFYIKTDGTGYYAGGQYYTLTNGLIELTSSSDVGVREQLFGYHANLTIVGTSDTSQKGFQIPSASNDIYGHTVNNIVANLSGSSSYAFYASSSGTPINVVGFNGLYNNTNDYAANYETTFGVDMTDKDVSETSDPFTDSASGDYSLKSSSTFVGAGGGWIGQATDSSGSLGAVQLSSAGGGGSSEHSYTFA